MKKINNILRWIYFASFNLGYLWFLWFAMKKTKEANGENWLETFNMVGMFGVFVYSCLFLIFIFWVSGEEDQQCPEVVGIIRQRKRHEQQLKEYRASIELMNIHNRVKGR